MNKWRWRCEVEPPAPPIADNELGQCYVRGAQPGIALGPRTAFGRQLADQAGAKSSDSRRGHPASAKERAKQRGKTTDELEPGIPQVLGALCKRSRYKLVGQGKWRWQQEHINVKEGRVALMGLRRACRSVKNMGSRLICLSDNQACIGAFEKGRSSAGLAPLCKRAAAYRLAGQIVWRLRYVESERNPSDEDSRKFDSKKVSPTTPAQSPSEASHRPSTSQVHARAAPDSEGPSRFKIPVPKGSSGNSLFSRGLGEHFCLELFGGSAHLTSKGRERERSDFVAFCGARQGARV